MRKDARLRVLSLGAGVQSTTMALMAAHGEISPMPDCAIFADTGAEPVAVYEHLCWLMSGNVLPFPVEVVSAGNLRDEILATTRGEGQRGSNARPPFYVRNPDGSKGMIRRQCTGDYKIDPIEKKTRELLGLKPRQRWPKEEVVEQWVGISTDEASRMKPSRQRAIRSRWPLIEARMSRGDCLEWLSRNGYPRPPKSACTFCPFRSNALWRHLRDTDPQGWAEAVTVDAAVREGLSMRGLTGQLYVHPSLVPLAEVDLSTAEERGQPDLFGNECEGMCGV
jgi:hypothetical protein